MALELLGYSGIKILTILLKFVNVGLLLGLIYIYTKSYRQIKFGFTVGIILFASLLLVKSLFAIGFILFDSDMHLDSHYILGSFLQIVAILILLKITWDY